MKESLNHSYSACVYPPYRADVQFGPYDTSVERIDRRYQWRKLVIVLNH